MSWGRLDATGCDEVGTAFTPGASAAPGDILVDLTLVRYIASPGIRMLIGPGRAVRRRGRTMVIFGARPRPSDVFGTVSLGDLIPLAANEAEALGLLAHR